MALRTWMVLGALAAVLAASSYLMVKEDITKSEQDRREEQKITDPHRDMKYTTANRRDNFMAFGMDERMADLTIKRLEQLDEERLFGLIRSADESSELADALCGSTRQLRPRYGALEFFVEEDNSKRATISLRVVSQLKRQEWAKTAPIQGVYETADLAKPNEPDSTLMAMAAIFTRKEDMLIDKQRPWGSSRRGRWSWEKVKTDNPGIAESMIEYFALMHLAVELARADGGICE